MKSIKQHARIVGILLLIQFAIGVLINQFLIGPVTFASDFLTNVSANSTQMIVGVLVGLIGGAIGVCIAVILLPIFKQYNKILAFLYFGFSLISFTMIIVDNISILSLLSLSEEFIKEETPRTDYYLTLGNLFYNIRLWTHFMVLLMAFFPLSTFYYLLYQSKLIPRFISVWGLIGAVLMLVAILLAMFSQGTNSEMMLFLPLGLNQLFLVGWLIIKGFNSLKTQTT